MTVLAFISILCHCKSLMPSKSMSQKSNHNFMKKYPYIRIGTLKPMRIKDILTKARFFAVRQRFKIRDRHIVT